MSIEIKINGLSDHLRGNIAVSRDSMIAISVMPIVGYEALRIMFTKDSLILINRTDKTYQASSLDYYLARYNIPVSFDDLQALLVNEAFFYMKGYKDREYKEEIKRENGQIILHIESIKGNQKITNQQITADNSCCQIENIFVADYQRNVQVEIKYNDFDDSKVWPFPNRVSVDIWDGINTISMNIRYHQIIFDDQINVRFEIPLNYSRAHM